MKNDERPLAELETLAALENESDLERREAETEQQIALLEARIRAARACGA